MISPSSSNRPIIVDDYTGPVESHPLVLAALTRFSGRLVETIPGEDESATMTKTPLIAPKEIHTRQQRTAGELNSLLHWGQNNPHPIGPGESAFKANTPHTSPKTAPLILPLQSSIPAATPEIFVESPLAPDSDPLVSFLEHLAEEYDEAGNIVDGDLARKIRVHTEYLLIDGIRVKRTNEIINPVTRRGTQEKYGTAVFPFDTVKNYFWDNLPTEEEWKKIIDAIPGKNDGEKRENTEQILGIIYTDTEYTKCIPQDAFFWTQGYSQPKNKKKTVVKIGRRTIISKSFHTQHLYFKNSGDIHKVLYSVRLIVR